jgi:hypothetical protein
MNATAASTSTVEPKSEPSFDRQWLKTALDRWKMSDEFVRYSDAELLGEEHPLRQFIAGDFPEVMRELVRLQPE